MAPARQTPAQANATKARKPKSPVRFRQREIERAIRGVQRKGLTVQRVEVDPHSGTISLVTGIEASKANDLDNWMKDHARRT